MLVTRSSVCGQVWSFNGGDGYGGADDDDDGDDGDDDDAHQAIKEHVIRVVLAKAGKRGLPQDAKELRVK